METNIKLIDKLKELETKNMYAVLDYLLFEFIDDIEKYEWGKIEGSIEDQVIDDIYSIAEKLELSEIEEIELEKVIKKSIEKLYMN